MGKFSLLFSVEIEHLFFPDRCCRDFDLVPSGACRKLISDTGLVIRNNTNGIYFFYDQNKKDALFLAAGNPHEPLHFFIKAYSQDPNFMNYTDCPASNEKSVLYFDNRSAKPKALEAIALNKERYVSDKDQKKITADAIASNLSKQDRLITPTFILDIFVNQGRLGILGKRLGVKPKHYVIRFRESRDLLEIFFAQRSCQGQFVYRGR